MPKRLLLGNEAVAQGAIDAGLHNAYAYPGTPSTELPEYLARIAAAAGSGLRFHWAANEKTALEEALGASYAGHRALAAMKHVGLNVAADAFLNAAIAGVNAGLIVVVGDDPSMHSSQNEQDSRLYAAMAMVPCLEPSTQQEAYEMPRVAFELSERLRAPVLLRLTTRLAHSRADVTLGDRQSVEPRRVANDRKQFILLPVNARGSYRRLVEAQGERVRASEESPFNILQDGPDTSLGIIACGIAQNYVLEAFAGPPPHPFLKLSQYPLPVALLEKMLARCPRVLVVEDGYPHVERALRGTPPRTDVKIAGRLSGDLPRTGELTPGALRRALAIEALPERLAPTLPVPRPPALCAGCPHADSFLALNAALASFPDARVFSDIGCYTLGALPPYESIDTCLDMGASVTMAKGAADTGLRPAVAVIGDSTFTHSGMTGLLDCVDGGTPVTVLVLDNATVAMTGGQPSLAEDRLTGILAGLGVPADHLRLLDPRPAEHDANVRILEDELRYDGLSVVVSRRECIQTARRRPRGGDGSSEAR
ncbi:MAG: indolepyruvate ferredoxin oxidoreductase [Candidatus Bipolaricaulota bacterium]|nr:MAG: indolepyruvate ferredoxin oxidoreductase [Candidatus Bipolaricaulota bacterium]